LKGRNFLQLHSSNGLEQGSEMKTDLILAIYIFLNNYLEKHQSKKYLFSLTQMEAVDYLEMKFLICSTGSAFKLLCSI